MGDHDTIIALASGTLPSGIAVLRISGTKCREILQTFVDFPPKTRHLALREIKLPVTGELIDEGLVVFFPGPGSFTGEDCLEFHLHGSTAIVRKFIELLSDINGVRLAGPGEFSRRAFENGKLDLLEIDGLGDLVSSETESQRVLAIARMKGSVSKEIDIWREELISCLAILEAQLDFSDDGDVDSFDRHGFVQRLEIQCRLFEEAISSYSQGRIIRDGFRVGLGGPPNVGKSSVLNYLAKSEVAIVTSEAGTTRDVNEVAIDIEGHLVILFDSAGIRETNSLAEKEGVRRGREMLAQCDLVLWLCSVDVEDKVDLVGLQTDMIMIANKADLGDPGGCDILVSSKSGNGFEVLTKAILERIALKQVDADGVIISHMRDRQALESGLRYLGNAVSLLKSDAQAQALELVAEEIRQSLFALQRLLGVVDVEDVLDQLFAGFCIGK